MKKSNNQILFERVYRLLNQYEALINDMRELMPEINKAGAPENGDRAEREEMLEYMYNTEEGQFFLRLANILDFAMFPQDQDVINNIITDIVENNAEGLEDATDVFELLNVVECLNMLVGAGKIYYDGVSSVPLTKKRTLN